MKKKVAALMMATAMVVMTAVPTFAYKDPLYSPTGTIVTETPPPESPKTGESDALLYGVGAAAVCGTVIVISSRKLKKS